MNELSPSGGTELYRAKDDEKGDVFKEDVFCRQLGNAISSKLGIEFNHQPVEHIFRVRKISGYLPFMVVAAILVCQAWHLSS